MPKQVNDHCPLCKSGKVIFFSDSRDIKYFRCEICLLIYMDRNKLLPFETEKERYSHHQYDNEYDNYLNEITEKIMPNLLPGNSGLDYGCGQFNVLSKILTRKGFPTSGYDPFYPKLADKKLLKKKYDFVISVETIEHFHFPFEDFTSLSKLLTDHGKFFIRTQLYKDSIDFDKWWYTKDDTHVSFYSDHTFEFMRKQFGLNIIIT